MAEIPLSCRLIQHIGQIVSFLKRISQATQPLIPNSELVKLHYLH